MSLIHLASHREPIEISETLPLNRPHLEMAPAILPVLSFRWGNGMCYRLGWVPVMTMPSNPARQTREHTERGKPLPNMTEAVAAQRQSVSTVNSPRGVTATRDNHTIAARQSPRTGRSSKETGSSAATATLTPWLQDTLVWEYVQEDDSCGTGVVHDLLVARDECKATSALPLSSVRASQVWRDYLRDAMLSAHGHNLSAGFTMSAKFGFPTSAHAIAASGADVLVLERMNDDVGSLAVGM